MRFIVNGSSFAKSLQSISGVLITNNTLPILDNFLFHLEDNTLTVTASDLETTLVVKIELENATIEGTDKVAVPAKMLLEILKTFGDTPLTFSMNEENEETYTIEISSGDGKYKLAGQNPNTYPTMPQKENTAQAVLSSEILANAITKTIMATCNDELRPQMSGVFCEMNTESVTFVATDAHKLVRYRRFDAKADEKVSFILPKKPLNLLKSILTGLKESVDVTIDYNKTNVFFGFANYFVVCRLIDGKYPNYENAIPKESPNKLIVDRNMFLTSVRRADIFANQATHQVRIKINGSEVFINAEDLEYANEALERITCSYEGEPIEIGFNAKFLVEMLNNVDTEQIIIEMSQPERAGIILPLDEAKNANEDLLMLVMPVMLAK